MSPQSPLPPPLHLSSPDGDGLALLHPGPGIGALGPALRRIEGGLLDLGPVPVLLPRPAIIDAALEDDGVLVASRSGPGRVRVERLARGAVTPVLELRGSGLRLGRSAVAWWRGTDGGVVDLHGKALPVPLAARERGSVPFPGGVAWAAGRTLLRWTPTTGARVTGSLPAPARRLWAGPGGACLVDSAAGAVLVRPGQEPRILEEVVGAVLSAAFFTGRDGLVLALEDEAGALRMDDGGAVLRRDGGRPAGDAGWLDPCGDLHPWSEEELPDLLPGPALRLGDVLHGPAGRAWDLATGEAIGPALTAGAELAATARELGEAAVLVDEGEVLIRTADGEEQHLAELPEEVLVLALQCRRGTIRAWDDSGRCWAGALDGDGLSPMASSPPLPRRAPLPGAARSLGLPLDGALVAPDGATWAWQEDGPLFRQRETSAAG